MGKESGKIENLNDVMISLSEKELAQLSQGQRHAYERMYFPHGWQDVIVVFRWLVDTRRKLASLKVAHGKLHRRVNQLQGDLNATQNTLALTQDMLRIERVQRGMR